MKKIHALVLKSYAGPLLATFFIALFVLLMQFLWKYIDDLVGKGLEWYIIAELMFYASSTFVPLALPLAILLSSLMTFGNLGEHYELVAMKSAGISLRSIMKPLIVLSVFISGFAFYFSNNILPVANLKFKALLYDVRQKKLAVNIKEGIFYNDLEDYVIRVGKKGKDGNTIYRVMVYNHTDHKGNIDVTVADSGIMQSTPDGRFLLFTLYDGYTYQEKVDQKNAKEAFPFQRTYFREQKRKFDLSTFELNRTDEELFKNNYEMLNIKQLNYFIDSLGISLHNRRQGLADNFAQNYKSYLMMDSVYRTAGDTAFIIHPAFIDSLSGDDKLIVTSSALSAARNLKRNLEFQAQTFHSSEEFLRKHKVVWHRKFTLSFACLVLFFIGAPLGAIIRKGGLGMPAVISILFFILYHITSMIGQKSALKGAMEVAPGMWLSSVVLLPLGIFLTYKATTDSPLMDMEIWNKVLGKVNIFKFIRKRKDPNRVSDGPSAPTPQI
ncbi:MAG: LptF/LptG family permease [Bacteroidales bacterium]|nr:LptF/LptG family permease [Bacteroidales bacterium]